MVKVMIISEDTLTEMMVSSWMTSHVISGPLKRIQGINMLILESLIAEVALSVMISQGKRY